MINIDLCLRLIGFGMNSNLINFQYKYYKYGEENLEPKGLAIGGYESSFLADLIDYYLLEVTNNQLKEGLYRGIYKYNRFQVFKGRYQNHRNNVRTISSKRRLPKL